VRYIVTRTTEPGSRKSGDPITRRPATIDRLRNPVTPRVVAVCKESSTRYKMFSALGESVRLVRQAISTSDVRLLLTPGVLRRGAARRDQPPHRPSSTPRSVKQIRKGWRTLRDRAAASLHRDAHSELTRPRLARACLLACRAFKRPRWARAGLGRGREQSCDPKKSKRSCRHRQTQPIAQFRSSLRRRAKRRDCLSSGA